MRWTCPGTAWMVLVKVGLPGADELAAVVGLPGGAAEVLAAAVEVGDDALGEQGRVGQGEFVGEAEEEQSGSHVSGGVLVAGQLAALEADPVLGDIA